MANRASSGGANATMLTGKVPRHGADRGALDATLRRRRADLDYQRDRTGRHEAEKPFHDRVLFDDRAAGSTDSEPLPFRVPREGRAVGAGR